MHVVRSQRLVPNSRWDGAGVRFTIVVDGLSVPCAISRAALEDVCGCRHIAPGDALRRFGTVRDRVEAMAASIVARRPDSIAGTIHVWADDVDALSTVVPPAGHQPDLPAVDAAKAMK